MNRTIVALLGALMLAAGLVSVTSSGASAAQKPPPIVYKLAKQMKCKYPERASYSGGGKNIGIDCRYLGRQGRQNISFRKYADLARAIDYWREWTEAWSSEDEPGCIARKGKILIIPMGGGSGEDDYAYTPKWCTLIAKRVDGRVIHGYPA